jgi:hypothetical protein
LWEVANAEAGQSASLERASPFKQHWSLPSAYPSRGHGLLAGLLLGELSPNFGDGLKDQAAA